jgi:hypothetical protein
MTHPEARVLKSPKSISVAQTKVIMGEIKRPPTPTSLNPELEAALERWKRAAERQGLFGSGLMRFVGAAGRRIIPAGSKDRNTTVAYVRTGLFCQTVPSGFGDALPDRTEL